ncbi:MAG TPA: endolytic transglycosylase MltG [Polyangiaceae bacterium]
MIFGAYLALDRAHLFSGSTAPPTRTTHAPVVPTVHVTIPEGYTRRQIAVLAQADGLTGNYLVDSRTSRLLDPRHYGASSSVHDLEGFLFPDTYFMTHGESAQRLVDEQLVAFQQHFRQLDLAHARAAGLSQYDVVTIASIIEREVQVPSDRALVSAVIYNRLHDGMTLGIDSTLRYYLRDFTHPLTQSELALNTAYNTRVHHGLPPTPISNPGSASLYAAAHPADVSYLYYVNKPNTCGKLAFATTDAEFQVEVNAYDVARAEAGGRSPTRCP